MTAVMRTRHDPMVDVTQNALSRYNARYLQPRSNMLNQISSICDRDSHEFGCELIGPVGNIVCIDLSY